MQVRANWLMWRPKPFGTAIGYTNSHSTNIHPCQEALCPNNLLLGVGEGGVQIRVSSGVVFQSHEYQFCSEDIVVNQQMIVLVFSDRMVGTWGWTGKVILGVSGLLVCPLSLSVGKLLLYPRCLWWTVKH